MSLIKVIQIQIQITKHSYLALLTLSTTTITSFMPLPINDVINQVWIKGRFDLRLDTRVIIVAVTFMMEATKDSYHLQF